MNKREAVKKQLGSVGSEALAQQICALFPKTPDNPDGYERPAGTKGYHDVEKFYRDDYEPKCSSVPLGECPADCGGDIDKCSAIKPQPDEGRLLTDEDIIKRAGKRDKGRQYCYKAIAKAQDAKTARTKDQECQARVERIKRKIEGKHTFTNDEWETLWKKERL